MAGWVALERRSDATTPTQSLTYTDQATGKTITRDLTPAESRALKADPDGFMSRIAPALEAPPTVKPRATSVK